MEILFKTEIGEETLSIQAGKLAKQASGSVVVQYGETIVLVTVSSADEPNPNASFLPLSVDYQEKIYSAGRIPGNYFRREIGRPSEKETLTARLTDRPIRPLFPKGYNYETQVIATVLSMDKVHEPDILAMIGTSAALEISEIPFDGPIASVRVGRIDGVFVINPTIEQAEGSDINLIVAGSRTGIIMVEGGSEFVSESDMIEAIFFAHREMQPIIDLQEKLKEGIGKAKREFTPPEKDPILAEKVDALGRDKILSALTVTEKIERRAALTDARKEVIAAMGETNGEEYADRESEISEAFRDLVKSISRQMIVTEQRRIDNRKLDEIRPVSCETATLPRVHGSALFTRGETQVLSALTLGSTHDEQRIETLIGDETSAFMLHYNFPPYSVGEVKRFMGPSRRDIGHGALAKRALERVLPDKAEFDYTIRIVAEVLESNGSSSMGTVCASSMALMEGGVPLKAPVSGIAMGLIAEGDQTFVLSDILGDEDQFGDMDFKVTGTRTGITAMQMDIKISELTREIMEKALAQAKAGRIHILDKMEETISAHREKLSPYAPIVVSVKVNPERIGEIIGPGGKNIRALQTETNTQISIDDTGLVKIAGYSQEEAAKAEQMVIDIGSDPEIGALFEGTVVRTTDFGAFVQIKPKTEGLVHISELAHYRVKNVTDIVKEGETLTVKVIDISRDGKIRLSHKATLEAPKDSGPESAGGGSSRGDRYSGGPSRGKDNRGPKNSRDKRSDDGQK